MFYLYDPKTFIYVGSSEFQDDTYPATTVEPTVAMPISTEQVLVFHPELQFWFITENHMDEVVTNISSKETTRITLPGPIPTGYTLDQIAYPDVKFAYKYDSATDKWVLDSTKRDDLSQYFLEIFNAETEQLVVNASFMYTNGNGSITLPCDVTNQQNYRALALEANKENSVVIFPFTIVEKNQSLILNSAAEVDEINTLIFNTIKNVRFQRIALRAPLYGDDMQAMIDLMYPTE